ncbi:MAG TPA: hypothetical protein VD993_12895 [Chitinophagaceae bacterium]|nr:hypothetical protein [Chitinophagaceae bacterium]
MNTSRRLRLYFWVLLALTLAYIAWSKYYLDPFTTGDIVKYEVAKTTEVAAQIKLQWFMSGLLETARMSIWLDYIFILLYTACLMMAVPLLGRATGHVLLLRTGRFISILLPVAAVCDVIENMAMMKTLAVPPAAAMPPFYVTLAYDMAVAKFSIIILAFLFLFICLLFWIGNKIKKPALHSDVDALSVQPPYD